MVKISSVYDVRDDGGDRVRVGRDQEDVREQDPGREARHRRTIHATRRNQVG